MQLKEKLQALCKETDTNEKGIKTLIEYYKNSLGWDEEKAIAYAIELFENGTIAEINVLGKSDDDN